ncbi:TolC family protein [Paraburkholderia phytofirmans]|uniref:TolC family protein n=1 Tax=Paraburkholderia phytofirmans TaxID=261302 RepID=UPI000AEB24BB
MNTPSPWVSVGTCSAARVIAVTALALAGCVNYFGIKSDKQMSAPTQYTSSQSLPNEDGQWPSPDWACQFGDPQLPQLIDEALQGNPSIAQAEARIAKASSYIESSKSTLYPKANGSYAWNRELFSGNTIFPPPYGGTWYSENRLAAEQTVTNLRMNRHATQIGLIKALGGGFDAKRGGLVVPTDVPASSASEAQAAN